MPDEAEMEMLMERLTKNFGNDIIKEERGRSNGEAESVQVLGSMAERSRISGVGGQNILEN